MPKDKVPVPTTELEVGMYVAELDRPWLGTPFLFQGFLIEDELAIKELQRYCKTVYVNVERFDETIITVARPGTQQSGPARRQSARPSH